MTTTAIDWLKAALADRYAIERELGRGGMGTVYLARDLKHHRLVALKVLLPELAAALGAHRFLNEIEVVAHLQHPHILPLFDSGETDGVVYFVMPFIEGESLKDRLQRETQLPIEEALQITKQVASALYYAHRQGVVHRDIKPANILLQDGQALLADFGIALGLSAATTDRLTWTGVSLGTPEYMSPEQASGERNIDARSDVYSLAAVLYEMLTGWSPHGSVNAQTVLARILTEPVVPVRRLREMVPLNVEAAIQKALAKLPADRFVTVSEFSRALAEPNDLRAIEPQISTPWSRQPKVYGLAFAALLGWIVAAAAGTAWWNAWQREKQAQRPVRRWEILASDSAPVAFVEAAPNGVGRPVLALSPNGDRLVYVAKRGKTTQLYQRELTKLEATPLSGTEGAYEPFFSPDGGWVAFFSGMELKKVSIANGQVVTLARVNDAYGGVWMPDGRILVAADEGYRPGWVPASGGAVQRIRTAPDFCWQFPEVLPDGGWVLHGGIDGALYLTSIDAKAAFALTSDGVRRRDSADVSKLIFGSHPRYVPTGHIVYLSGDGILMALPFDAAHRRVLGPPVPILSGIRQEAESRAGQLSIADDGTLAYAPGVDAGLSAPVWVSDDGRIDTLSFPRAHYGAFDLSSDGKQMLVRLVPASGRAELQVLDLERGSQTRIATSGIPSFYPRWMPGGTELLYGEFTPNGSPIAPVLRQLVSAAAAPETLTAAVEIQEPSPDGKRLLVVHWRNAPGTWLLPAAGGADSAVRLLPNDITFPAFSHDGKWLAYSDAGPPDIYVIPVENPRLRYRVSLAGGEEGLWSRADDRIIYRKGQRWYSVDVATKPGFRAGRPRLLFEGPYLNVAGWSHDIAADGRQLMLLGTQDVTTTRIVAVQHWFDELERLAAPGKK